jgi:surfeit locus 1 family protein
LTPAPPAVTAPSPRSRKRAAVVLLAAVAGAALTARLGVWQLDRAAEKTALAASIESRSHMPELPLAALATTPAEAEAQHWRKVRLRGRWLAAHTVFLDNRQMDGRPGFFVVTPLQLGPGDAVLVQRGWAPRNQEVRSTLPPVATPAGEVEVLGLIAPPPSRLYEFGHEASGPIRQNLELAAASREFRIGLRPLSVWQLDAAANPGDGLARHWPVAAVDVSTHYGYAFQWFALSALIAGLYVWFQLVRPRLRQRAR